MISCHSPSPLTLMSHICVTRLQWVKDESRSLTFIILLLVGRRREDTIANTNSPRLEVRAIDFPFLANLGQNCCGFHWISPGIVTAPVIILEKYKQKIYHANCTQSLDLLICVTILLSSKSVGTGQILTMQSLFIKP